MIRDVVVHLLNEQPLLADLFEMPTATDSVFVFTNLRTLDGRRPIFVDHVDSTFYFPMQHLRFLEVPPERPSEGSSRAGKAEAIAAPPTAPEEDLEIDEEFLRRIREA